MTTEQYESLAQWAFQEFNNAHTVNNQVREKLLRHQERHDAARQDFQALYARLWEVEQRLERAEGRLATVAAAVTQMAKTVNRVAEVAESAKTQARTDNNGVSLPPSPKPKLLTY